MKRLQFFGSSREDLRKFPQAVRRAIGLELLQVQQGDMPSDFKPMPTVGKGVYEIRIHLEGAWRLLYVARFEDAVWVLHAFHKKTPKTAREDIELAQKRFRMLERTR